jgi:hypothetical protein
MEIYTFLKYLSTDNFEKHRLIFGCHLMADLSGANFSRHEGLFGNHLNLFYVVGIFLSLMG